MFISLFFLLNTFLFLMSLSFLLWDRSQNLKKKKLKRTSISFNVGIKTIYLSKLRQNKNTFKSNNFLPLPFSYLVSLFLILGILVLLQNYHRHRRTNIYDILNFGGHRSNLNKLLWGHEHLTPLTGFQSDILCFI